MKRNGIIILLAAMLLNGCKLRDIEPDKPDQEDVQSETAETETASAGTEELESQGIPVFIGHHAENIIGADCIIRTAAAHNDNPEIAAARANGIPVFERAQAWGEIMKSY